MKYLIYLLLLLTLASCEKEEIIVPQIKQPQGESTTLVTKSKKSEKKLKFKKKRKVKK